MIEKYNLKYERSLLVGLLLPGQHLNKLEEYLKELKLLSNTAGAKVIKIIIQKLDKPNHKFFIGKGKILEISNIIKNNNIDVLIFDDDLTPSQLKNIINLVKIKVVDRTQVILDIFAQRAKSSYATTQVELAQYKYLLPRLTNMWTHLERQRGGIGLRGPGEREIETDRRIVRNKISSLKKKLLSIDKQMITQRKKRSIFLRSSLIGYTNSGKSSLMNSLCKENIFYEDKLFATLDTTVRKVSINNKSFLLSDTVGFIRKLPVQLIESFKSTLNEVIDAEILLHVVDISNHSFLDHIKSVNEIISNTINYDNKIIIFVLNKIDLIDNIQNIYNKIRFDIQIINRLFFKNSKIEYVFMSVKNKDNINILRNVLNKYLK